MSNMEAKPRLVRIAGDELQQIMSASDCLGVPVIHAFNDGPPYLVDADELRAWRASQHTSGEQRD